MPSPLDIIGKRFGMMKVIANAPSHVTSGGNMVRKVKCLCDCGKEYVAYVNKIVKPRKIPPNCGCYKPSKGRTKKCRKCGKVKLRRFFYNRPSRDGKHSYCKECFKYDILDRRE